MYTALVLTAESKASLLERFGDVMPAGWDHKGHHMTINMGLAKNGPAANMLGQEKELSVVSLAFDNRVVAVGVESDVPSNNMQKHITLAVNVKDGAKPKHSNELVNWTALDTPVKLRGIVAEVA